MKAMTHDWREPANEPDERLDRVRLGDECPECGERENIEDNGQRFERTYLCSSCGMQWDRHIGVDR